MATASPRQFSIRTLLILTALVAVDLAWVRNFSDRASLVGTVVGLHALMAAFVWTHYWIGKNVIKTVAKRQLLGWLSTTLAGACFASMYLGVAAVTWSPRPSMEISQVIPDFVALAIIGGIVAGLPGVVFAVICDMAARLAPPQYVGRTQATLTGIATAATTAYLLLSTGVFPINLAVPIGFAIAICYPFGRLWDIASPPRNLFPSNIQELDMHWADESNTSGNWRE
jgi:hypothetical protein